jgi:hypothetical protein
MMKTTTTILAVSLLISGCVARPSVQQVATADYGQPPSNYQESIRGRISPSLFDPYSAVYQFAAPVRKWTRESPFESFRPGWAVCGTVNAKNRFGGYVGITPFAAKFEQGALAFLKLGMSPGIEMGSQAVANARNSFLSGYCTPTPGTPSE